MYAKQYLNSPRVYSYYCEPLILLICYLLSCSCNLSLFFFPPFSQKNDCLLFNLLQQIFFSQHLGRFCFHGFHTHCLSYLGLRTLFRPFVVLELLILSRTIVLHVKEKGATFCIFNM